MTAHFRISPRVLLQLGEELITDIPQALLELAKNSYDAGSARCEVVVDTSSRVTLGEEVLVGTIVVTDYGSGMSAKDINEGWLFISKSMKSEQKMKAAEEAERAEHESDGPAPRRGANATDSKHTTQKPTRAPLGDKGLGRLATMRLGNVVIVTTWDGSSPMAYKVTVDWRACIAAESVEKAPVTVVPIKPAEHGKRGTVTTILGLKGVDYWKTQDNTVQVDIARLISLFPQHASPVGVGGDGGEGARAFVLKVIVDKVKMTPTVIEQALLKQFELHFQFFFLERSENPTPSASMETSKPIYDLQIEVTIRHEQFQSLDRENYDRFVAPDKGAALLAHLKEKQFAKFHIAAGLGASMRMKRTKTWSEWEEIANVKRMAGVASPGPFMGEIYTFSRKLGRPSATGENNIAKMLDQVGGVLVFRDGFRVLGGKQDWLRLGDAWTSGPSWYGLRPRNTIGYVHLTVLDNGKLIEKSDREGFIEVPPTRGFFMVCAQLVREIGDITNRLGRGYKDFVKAKLTEAAGKNEMPSSVGEAFDEHKALIAEVQKRTKAATDAAVAAQEDMAKAQERIAALPLDAKFTRPIVEIQGNAAKRLVDVENELRAVSDGMEGSGAVYEWLRTRADELLQQVKELNELVGLGLAASGLVHEVDPFVSSIVDKTRQIDIRAQKLIASDVDFPRWSETIRSYAETINRKLSFLNPMLRAHRERKAKISLIDGIREYFDERRRTVYENKIIYVAQPQGNSGVVTINRGRFFQIFDNLTRNSEHWLATSKTKDPTIKATVNGLEVTFEDNGPGVDPQYEDILFQLFVSAKPDGHGIGLYLVDEIMQDLDGTIALLPDKNKNGRRYRFSLNFNNAGPI